MNQSYEHLSALNAKQLQDRIIYEFMMKGRFKCPANFMVIRYAELEAEYSYLETADQISLHQMTKPVKTLLKTVAPNLDKLQTIQIYLSPIQCAQLKLIHPDLINTLERVIEKLNTFNQFDNLLAKIHNFSINSKDISDDGRLQISLNELFQFSPCQMRYEYLSKQVMGKLLEIFKIDPEVKVKFSVEDLLGMQAISHEAANILKDVIQQKQDSKTVLRPSSLAEPKEITSVIKRARERGVASVEVSLDRLKTTTPAEVILRLNDRLQALRFNEKFNISKIHFSNLPLGFIDILEKHQNTLPYWEMISFENRFEFDCPSMEMLLSRYGHAQLVKFAKFNLSHELSAQLPLPVGTHEKRRSIESILSKSKGDSAIHQKIFDEMNTHLPMGDQELEF